MNEGKFHSDQHLTRAELIDYSRGYLSNSEMHRLEVHLVSCELCNEALEGIKMLVDPNQLNDSVKKISVATGAEEKKGLSLYQYLGMAASVILIAVVGFIMLRNSDDQESIATKQQVAEQVEEPNADNKSEGLATEAEDSSMLAMSPPTDAQLSAEVPAAKVESIPTQQEPAPLTTHIEQDTAAVTEVLEEEQDELMADLVMDDAADTLPDSLALGYGITLVDSPQIAASRNNAAPVVTEPMRAAEKKAFSTEAPYLAARPEKGMRSYERYLKRKMKYPTAAKDNNIEGDVVLKITINADGTVGDIEVTRSLGYGCDEEAIRLIKGGGNWIPGTRNGVAITDTASVTVSFRK